jgi:phospholipid-binding lipoprotein MlaA
VPREQKGEVEQVRSTFGLRLAGLLFSVLAMAVSGCSTLSGGSRTQSELLGSAPIASPIRWAEAAREDPLASAPVAAAVSAEAPNDFGLSDQPKADEATTVAAGPNVLPVAPQPVEPGHPDGVASAAPPLSQAAPGPVDVAQRREPEAAASDVQVAEYDPWEPFNEKMFTFNYNFDKYLLKPVAKGYNFVVPDRVQLMIANGFDNINPVPRWVNSLLQANFKGFFTEIGRFLINSTLGIGGLFDIAKQEFGLEKVKADFGQTLGKWGIEPGPFLILPFLPPLTVRDGIGYGVDGAMDPLSYVLPFFPDRLAMKVGQTVNDRALNLDLFQGFEETTVDLYSAVRNGYLQRRYNLIHEPQ